MPPVERTKARKKSARKAAAGPRPAPKARSRFWWYATGVVLLCCAGFLAYAPVLNGPFVFDDSLLPFRMPNFSHDVRPWIAGVRPLLMLSYWVNFRISETDTFWYHVFNVLFHIANSLLVFLIVRKVLRIPRAEAQAGANRIPASWLAAFASGLFLLHPIQSESVAYVASRSESLSLLFFFSAFALFLYRGTEAVSWRAALGIILLYGAAVSVKEHTVALIAVLLLTDYYWNPGFSFAGIRHNWRLYGPIVLAGIAAVVETWQTLTHTTSAGFSLKDFTWYQYFFTQCRAFFVYLRLFVLPVNQNADYNFAISRTILDHGAIFGLLGILLLAAAAFYFRRRAPLASYGFFVFLALLAPTSSFIPIHDALAERRLYLPMIGLLFIVADLLERIEVARRTLAAALAALLVTAGGLAYARNGVWSSDVALWEDTVRKAPDNARAHFQLAYAYQFGEGRCELALPEYEAAARLMGPRYDLLVDWAHAYDCVNQPEQALAKLRQAAALEPNAHAYMEIAVVLGKNGRYREAADALDHALKIDPRYVMAYVNRGVLHLKTNQPALAAEDYRHALDIEPSNPQALAGLAQAQQSLGAPR